MVLKSKFDSELLHHLLLCSHSPNDAPPRTSAERIHSRGTGASIQPGSLLLHQTAGWFYIRRRATVYQDVMTRFKLYIIFNINCVLMRHGFHSLHPLSMSNKYFKRKQKFTHLRRMNM